MIRASRVEEDRAALDRGSNEKVAATIDIADAMQLELAHEVTTDGKATVQLRGELDIATADRAFAYLCDVVDSQQGPVTVDLADLTFCDAAGLGVLARVAGHARRSGHSVELAAARPVTAADHAHHRNGRNLSRGRHSGTHDDRLATPGHR